MSLLNRTKVVPANVVAVLSPYSCATFKIAYHPLNRRFHRSTVWPLRLDAVTSIPPQDGLVQNARRVGLNTIWQIGGQIAPAAAAIAVIPFLLRHLGSELFGIVSIFSTTLLYFTMLDLGLGRAATRFIAQSMERGRPDDLRHYFWGSIYLLVAFGIVFSSGCISVVPILVSKYLKISSAYSHSVTKSFYIICLAIPVITLTATLRGFLEASGKFPLVSLVVGGAGVGTYLLPLFAVSMGGGLVAIAASFASVRVAMCVAFIIACYSDKSRPSLRPVFDTVAVKKMLSFGGWLSVSNVVGTAMIYCDRLLLGILLGMTAVTNYSAPLDLVSRLQILSASFCTVLFPLMSRLDESGSSSFQSVYRAAIGVSLSLMVPLAGLAVIGAPELMKLWLGPRNTPDAVFAAQAFLAGAIVQAIAVVAWTALHARGRSDLTAWVHLLEFPLYCAGFYWAATRFGVRGAALAWLGRGVLDFLLMVMLLRLLHKKPRLIMPPESVVAVLPVGILFLALLPWKQGTLVAVVLSLLTWMWAWRKLIDAPIRVELSRALSLWKGPMLDRS